jgi:hypothetical protein
MVSRIATLAVISPESEHRTYAAWRAWKVLVEAENASQLLLPVGSYLAWYFIRFAADIDPARR